MISTFNLTKLRGLLEDFYNLTQIRVAVFDENMKELASWPEELAPFCRIMRSSPEGDEDCRNCDQRSCEYAARHHETYTYRCHAGLTESITPLYMGNLLIGYLLFGHVFGYPSYEEGWRNIHELTKDMNLDDTALKRAMMKQPIRSPAYIASAAHILSAVGTYLCMERMVSLHQEDLPVQIDSYLSEHFTEGPTADEICRRFAISRSQLYEISSQSYGCGIAEHIRDLRIEKARKLLVERPDLSIADIAGLCGYEDYNYFITVFRRVTGVPPRRYRAITS